MKYLALLVFLVGCGIEDSPAMPMGPQDPPCRYEQAVFAVDSGLVPYVRAFYEAAGSHGVERCHSVTEVKIKADKATFRTPHDSEAQTTIGVCYGYRQIALWDKWWTEASERSRYALVFHELGHCALGLDHSDADVANIMNPIVLDPDFAEDNWDWLTDKLFRKDLSLTE